MFPIKRWVPPVNGSYPAISHAATADLNEILPGWTQDRAAGAIEQEFFFVRKGHLAPVAEQLRHGAVPEPFDAEINAAAGEVATSCSEVAPGFYRDQEDQLSAIIGRMRCLASTCGCEVLLATAGMAPENVPDPWNPEADFEGEHFAMFAPKERYKRMARNAARWHGPSGFPQLGPPEDRRTLLPVYGGLAASSQGNISFPKREFARWRRATIAIASIATAVSAGSPLFLGRPVGLHAHRVVTFPGAYYGMDERCWPNHFDLAPGGHLLDAGQPLEGDQAVRAAIQAQLDTGRPFLADPPPTMAQELLRDWAEKSCYAGSRVRYGRSVGALPAHVRLESRWGCAQPTVLDNVANLYLQHTCAAAYQELYGDGATIPYDVAQENFLQAVQHGLGAMVTVPHRATGALVTRPVVDVAQELLPVGYDWHLKQGFTPSELDRVHNAVCERVAKRQNFAELQLRWFEHAPSAYELFHAIAVWGESEEPLSSWPICWDVAAARL